MGLYLCVFRNSKDDDELDGVEIGSYEQFAHLRQTVAQRLEGGAWGSRFPVLMTHSDSDGVWSPKQCEELERELLTISDELTALAPEGYAAEWQREVARSSGLIASNLLDNFIDVDGESLIERLIGLSRISVSSGQPIWFQ